MKPAPSSNALPSSPGTNASASSCSPAVPTALAIEARHAAFSHGRNVTQHGASHTLSPRGLRSVHRLDLAMIHRQLLERADAQEVVIVPHRPKADVWRLQPSEVQGVRTSRRGLRPSAGEMTVQEIDHARIAQVTWDDTQHVIAASSLRAFARRRDGQGLRSTAALSVPSM